MKGRLSILLCLFLVAGSQAQDVEEADSQPTDSEPAPSAAAKELSVSGLSAVVFSNDGKKLASKEGKLGSDLLRGVLLKAGQSVEVSFTPQLDGAATKPQQAMLMAVSKEQPALVAYAVAKAKKDGLHVATLATAAVEKQLGPLGGEFDVALLLGDPAAPHGLSGSIGSLALPDVGDAKPKLLTAASQPTNNLKPNIEHIFRPPASRPPAIVSLVFTGLALAPLVFLLGALGLLGVNLKALPVGPASLWVLLFHGGIAALLGLYLLFWLRLNLATTLPLALGLGLFIAATGYKALGALSDARLAEAKAVSSGKKTN